ncbi:pyridoxal phosphate-dependent transferase [Aspergillus similis]
MATQYLNLHIPPADPAFSLMADFEADPHPSKVSLVAGAYRDENGNPWVLPSVRKAKESLSETTHEYLGIAGSPTFIDLAKELIFGPILPRLQGNTASIQTVSGTGANHLAAMFLARHLRPTHVFLPAQTWINHRSIWEMAGVPVAEYTYYSSATKTVDFSGMLSTLDTAEVNDVVILQACAHNPTGVDLSQSQWMQLADLVRRKHLFVVFDSAYQGFATADIDGDAWAVRHFAENLLASESKTHPGMCVAQSFPKNFGLYGERVGALHLVVPPHLSAQGARGALMAIARAEYSNPPRFGARIVELVLGDLDSRAQWERDLGTMSLRIRTMRRELRRRLEGETGQDWSHLETQIGMFSYTGLDKEQVARLRDEFHVYMLPSGRISVCGLNEGNVQYVAHAIGQVVKPHTSK